MPTELSNPENSALASDALQLVAQLVGERDSDMEVKRAKSEGQKGDIILQLILGVSSAAVYDLLKAVVLRFARREDYDRETYVIIDGVRVEFKELEGDPKELDA